ncbi:MAG: hypothetical protein HKO68_10480 [Desulfobacterales bacterium]|nr:hypothetical protein [Desulfobacterales bacterium]
MQEAMKTICILSAVGILILFIAIKLLLEKEVIEGNELKTIISEFFEA